MIKEQCCVCGHQFDSENTTVIKHQGDEYATFLCGYCLSKFKYPSKELVHKNSRWEENVKRREQRR